MENERDIMTRSKSMSPRYGPHFISSHSLQLRLTHNDLPASPIVRLRFLSARPPPSDIYPLLQALALLSGFQRIVIRRIVIRRGSDVGMRTGIYARAWSGDSEEVLGDC